MRTWKRGTGGCTMPAWRRGSTDPSQGKQVFSCLVTSGEAGIHAMAPDQRAEAEPLRADRQLRLASATR